MRANATKRRIGVALEADRLVASLPEEKCWIRPLAPSAEGESWTDLTDAFEELRRVTGVTGGTLYVALMPPLSQLRRLDLAGATEAEATRIVSRDPARFLPLRSKRLAVELRGTGWRRSAPFLLAAAPSAAVEAIGASARQAGWSLGALVPAPIAWIAASDSPHEALIVYLGTHIEIVRIERNGTMSLRRIPVPHGEAMSAAEARTLCTERGIAVSSSSQVIASRNEAAVLAAQLAPGTSGPNLVPAESRALVMQRARRAIMLRLTAAALLLGLAGGLELLGLARERASIAAERTRIRRTVAHALVVRESVAVLSERLAAVREISLNSPRWSAWLATLADALPSDAFLASLNAEGDSLHLEGNATRAAPVFDALTSVRGIQGVRPEGAIRQDVRNGGATSEHFVLAAVLAPSRAP